jgi:AraC-like DNA-binding protein
MKSSLHSVIRNSLHEFKYMSIQDNLDFRGKNTDDFLTICCLQHGVRISGAVDFVLAEGQLCTVPYHQFRIHALSKSALLFIFSHEPVGDSRMKISPVSNRLLLCMLELVGNAGPVGDQFAQELLLLAFESMKEINFQSDLPEKFDFRKSLIVYKWQNLISERNAKSVLKMKRSDELTIRELFGSGRNGLLHEAKMRSAWQLLNDRRESLEQVAMQLGYQNVRNFISAFRKYFGVTPGAVQKANLFCYS